MERKVRKLSWNCLWNMKFIQPWRKPGWRVIENEKWNYPLTNQHWDYIQRK